MDAGYSLEHAEAYGLIIAAHAERMAPIFGRTPKDFLDARLAGFQSMSPQEFGALRHLDELLDGRAFDQLMTDMGVRPGMSRTQKRRLLQPEFDYAWGGVNPESFINTYGKSVYNEMRRQFGPGFFAKRGEGRGLDVLAADFRYEERGGYDATSYGHDESSFAEKVMAPHDQFEADMRRSMGGYFQAAMRKSDAANVRDFVDSVPQRGNVNKSYVHIREVGGEPVQLATDQVRHIRKRHPNFDEWERIPDPVEKGHAVQLDYDPYSYRTATAHILNEGETSLVTIGVHLPAGKRREPRFNVLTAFRENTEAVNGWLEKRDTANTPDAGQAAPIPVIGGESINRIGSIEAEVNALLRGKGKAFEQTPRGGIRQLDDGRYIVGLFKNKDASTVLHESGHFFLENLREAAMLESAPAWTKESWGTLQKEYGFEPNAQGEAWRAVQERFARKRGKFSTACCLRNTSTGRVDVDGVFKYHAFGREISRAASAST